MADSGTPGPWEARHSIAGCIDSVWDSNGNCLAHIVRAPGEMSVSDANARKMAAAPDMEAALATLLESVITMRCDQHISVAVIADAYDALTKTRGAATEAE